MNFNWRTPLGAAIAGAVCMLIFEIALIVIGTGSVEEPSLVGDFSRWLSSPVASLLENANRGGLLNPENVGFQMTVLLTYEMIVGAIAGVAVYCLVVLARKLWRI